MRLLLSVSLKDLATVGVAVITCGTTVMIFLGTVVVGYVKSIRDNMNLFHASRIEHGAKIEGLEKRTTRIEDKLFP